MYYRNIYLHHTSICTYTYRITYTHTPARARTHRLPPLQQFVPLAQPNAVVFQSAHARLRFVYSSNPGISAGSWSVEYIHNSSPRFFDADSPDRSVLSGCPMGNAMCGLNSACLRHVIIPSNTEVHSLRSNSRLLVSRINAEYSGLDTTENSTPSPRKM